VVNKDQQEIDDNGWVLVHKSFPGMDQMAAYEGSTGYE